jgi:hypothetical protein
MQKNAAKAEAKGYSDPLRFFAEATGMAATAEVEIQSRFRVLRDRLDGLHRFDQL